MGWKGLKDTRPVGGLNLSEIPQPLKEIPNMRKKTSFQYNKEYWKTISKDYEKTAKILNKVRWDFVKEIKPKVVLDYGAGANFLTKFVPKGITIDSFDLGRFPMKYTGIRHNFYDLVFFCDVLEHFPDFRVLDKLFKNTDYVYVSLPILPDGKKLITWKHFKFDTGEHLHFFTKRSLDLFFEARGFKLIKSGYPEVECGVRKDIYSALYRKKKIVFVNGVFDLIHVGHIYLFAKAKELGDILVVGLNSDRSAAKIKREPINSQEKRKKLLESIKHVDKVEIFDELNPLRLMKEIKPDIVIKGSDYTRKTVIGYEFVESYGGRIVIIPTLEHHSTTRLIQEIKGCSFSKNLPKIKGGYIS